MKNLFVLALMCILWVADTRYRDTLEVCDGAGVWTEILGPYAVKDGSFCVPVAADKPVQFFRIRREYGVFNAI